jgi:hypothetical protein
MNESRSSPSFEEIDLAVVTARLNERLGSWLRDVSYLRGKTLLRNEVVRLLGCSDCLAEELVETLELRGYIEFPHFEDDTHPIGRRVWRIGGRSVG